jgi:hypothetical protein
LPPEHENVDGVHSHEERDQKRWRHDPIIVDLEEREVVDLFPERAAGMTADWFKKHPGVEIISRDRCGSFAQGAQEGAPQARQIADRFHIVKNMREAIQVQLSRAPGFCARPLLPTDGEEVASVRDKHGGNERTAASPESRTSIQGKRFSTTFARSGTKAEMSVRSCDKRGSIAARSPNGFEQIRFPNGALRRLRRRRRDISKIIYHVAGQKVACAAVAFSGNQSARLHRKFFKP